VNNATPTSFSGAIQGKVSLTKIGSDVLTLGGNNTYSEATNVAIGTLKLASSTALGGTLVGTSISSGASLDLNGQTIGNEAIPSIAGAGVGGRGALLNGDASNPASLAGTVTMTANTTIGGAGSMTLSNTVGGSSFNLTKTGAGVVTLAGNNSYGGTTSVTQGSFYLNGTHSGGGAYSATGTATLGGSGIVTPVSGANVTISSGANISPGSAPSVAGKLTLNTSGAGATILNGGGSYVWDSSSGSNDSQSAEATTHGTPGTSWDSLTLAALSINATNVSGSQVVIVISPVGNFNATHDPNKPGKWAIATFTSILNFDISKFLVDTSHLTSGQNLGGFYVSPSTQMDGSGELDLNYVPEPSLGGLVLTTGALAALRRRRRLGT